MRGEEQLQQRRAVATAATNSLVFNAFIWLQVRPLMRSFLAISIHHLLVILLTVLGYLIGSTSLKLSLPFASCLPAHCMSFVCPWIAVGLPVAYWPLLQSVPILSPPAVSDPHCIDMLFALCLPFWLAAEVRCIRLRHQPAQRHVHATAVVQCILPPTRLACQGRHQCMHL